MDDKWFKHRQKIAGVTAEDIANKLGRDRSVVSRIYVGRQSMSADQARVFAEVLDVPLSEVMERAGILNREEAQMVNPGFSDGDAALFTPKGADQPNQDTKAAAFGGEKPGIDVWRIKTRAMQLSGYMPGDCILVDSNQSEICRTGDIVLAQQYNHQTGTATTILRRYEPPVLVAASPDPEDERVKIVDGDNIVIRGKVIASWRQ
ncbi:MAG: hypothetical protein AB3N12_01570 [Ruegeria sp.]